VLHPDLKHVLQAQYCSHTKPVTPHVMACGPESLSSGPNYPCPHHGFAQLQCCLYTAMRTPATCEGTPFIAPASWPSRRPSRATITALSACRSCSWAPVCRQRVSPCPETQQLCKSLGSEEHDTYCVVCCTPEMLGGWAPACKRALTAGVPIVDMYSLATCTVNSITNFQTGSRKAAAGDTRRLPGRP
jgi:hypothetical protein